MSSLYFGVALLFNNDRPYLETNSIVYHLDNDNVVTSVDITITNPSLKSVNLQKLILRYCREDRYPEGYSSPIEFSLKPLERKTITISEFRNVWVYNKSYHLETDNGQSLSFKNYNPQHIIGVVSLSILPIIIALFLICLYQLTIISNKKYAPLKTLGVN